MNRIPPCILIALFLVFATGCGSSPQDSHGGGHIESIKSGFRVVLGEAHGSGLRGEARVIPRDDRLRIELSLEDLEPRTRYNAHLHRGTCHEGAGGGISLNSVTAGPGGRGQSVSEVSFQELNPTFHHVIMVHEPGGRHGLCGRIPTVEKLRSNST